MGLPKLLLAIFVILCLYSTFSQGSPQQCQETTIQYNGIYNNFSISISADLKISSPNNITVTNIKASATNLTTADTSIIFKNICGWERAGFVIACNKQFTDPFTFSVTGSNVVELQVSLAYKIPGNETDITPAFYSSVFDGNSFSFYDGRIFDENNKCFNYNYTGIDAKFNITECCTLTKSFNISNTDTSKTCVHFNSTSLITNNADKSTYASMTLDYDIKNGNVTLFGRYYGPTGYQPYLIIDDAQGCVETINNTLYCGYPLYPSGNKLLVFLSESYNNTAQIYGYANKIIIRENQTYMTDDKQFTPTNNCQTINAVYDSNRNLSVSTFACCTTFQDNDLTSPSPSPSSSTVTSGSESFSNLNFFSLFLTLIVSVVIFA